MNHLTLTPQSQKWVQDRIQDGTFAGENEYFNDLVRRDMLTLLAELKKGEDSGVCTQSMDEILAEAERDYLARKEV
jgi:Arc/MetJ-type ribon-helix-helix transcriptional regulator